MAHDAVAANPDAVAEISRLLSLETRSPTMFEILGVDTATATMSSVKKAYNRLVLLTHPDKVGLVANAAEAFALVNKAYKALACDALIERAKAAALKRTGHAQGAGIAGAGIASGGSSTSDLERAMLNKVREEYLAALRETEEKDRRRHRDEEEERSKQQERSQILQHEQEWQRYRTKPPAPAVHRRF